MNRVLLESYINKNFGDDLFLKAIANRYPEVVFDVISNRRYLRKLNIKNIRRQKVWIFWLNKVKIRFFNWHITNRWCVAHVLLGGSMFIEGKKTEKGLKEWLQNKYPNDVPLFVLGANFGPYNNKFYLKEYKKLFTRAEDVCFRERYSAGLFKDLKNVRVAPDIIFGLDKEKYLCKQEKKVVISVINLENRDNLKNYLDDYESKIVEIASEYAGSGYDVVLMSFCKYEGDEDVVNRIIARSSSSGNIKPYYYDGNIDEALRQIASSEIVIGTRFHAVILGLVFGKKVLPIIYSDKTKHTLDDIKFKGDTVEISDISTINVSNINDYLTAYGDISELHEQSNQHFAKLDEFLKEN